MFFCQDVTDHCTVEGSADSLPFVCRDNSTPPLLGSKHGLGSAGFHQWYADNFWVLARGANCTHNHLARLIAGAQKAGLDVHDVVHASGSADVLGYEVSLANSCCGGAGKQKSCMRSVGRTVSSRRRISGRAMEFFSGHESFVALSNRGALSILDASFKFPRASCLVTVEPWSTVRLQQRACGGILCLLRSDWSLRWLDVCVCADPSEKGFAFAVREGCRELASEVGRFSEQTRFKRTSKSIRARSRHFIPSLLEVGFVSSSSDEDARNGDWRGYRAFFREENIMTLEARSILYAVRYAESCCPPGRLPILSAKDAQTNLHCFQSCVESLRLARQS